MNRRIFIASAAAAVATLVSPARSGGKRVYLDYTQEELKRAYNQWAWAPNANERLKILQQESISARAAHPPREFAYGPTAAEKLDVFAPSGAAKAPIMVYIHGGGWRMLSKEESAGEAGLFLDNGIIYVVLNFALVPDVRLPAMVEQVRKALAWVYANAETFGGDRDRIHIWGASSGAHLAGVMLTTDWSRRGLPAKLIKGGMTLSGSYDLEPLVLSQARTYLVVNSEEIRSLSPMRHVSQINCPLVVGWGDKESPEYIRQGTEFASALEQRGLLGARIVLPDTNHFEVTSHLRRPESALSAAILRQIRADAVS